LFWVKDTVTGEYTSAFWKWLDMKELSSAPLPPFQWTPDRYLWWWRASRVLQDYDMRHNPLEVIDEFPFFSFLLGDLHPHVLAIPFGLLAIAVALKNWLADMPCEARKFITKSLSRKEPIQPMTHEKAHKKIANPNPREKPSFQLDRIFSPRHK